MNRKTERRRRSKSLLDDNGFEKRMGVTRMLSQCFCISVMLAGSLSSLQVVQGFIPQWKMPHVVLYKKNNKCGERIRKDFGLILHSSSIWNDPLPLALPPRPVQKPKQSEPKQQDDEEEVLVGREETREEDKDRINLFNGNNNQMNYRAKTTMQQRQENDLVNEMMDQAQLQTVRRQLEQNRPDQYNNIHNLVREYRAINTKSQQPRNQNNNNPTTTTKSTIKSSRNNNNNTWQTNQQQQRPSQTIQRNNNYKNNRFQQQQSRRTNQNHRKNNNNNNGRKLSPWQAPYEISRKSHNQLLETIARYDARINNNNDEMGYQRATRILQTLLDQKPYTNCNPSNLIGALFIATKCLPDGTSFKMTREYKKVLFQVLDIWHDLVERKTLSSRQLCNSLYCVAKHYNVDATILPTTLEATSGLSSSFSKSFWSNSATATSGSGTLETWVIGKSDLNEDNMMSDATDLEISKKTLEITLTMVVKELREILQTPIQILQTRRRRSNNNKDNNKRVSYANKKPTVVELFMSCWAVSVLQQRTVPPGWRTHPQMSRLPDSATKKKRKKKKNTSSSTNLQSDFMFEWSQYNYNDDNNNNYDKYMDDDDDDEDNRDNEDDDDDYSESWSARIETDRFLKAAAFHLLEGDLFKDFSWSEMTNTAWAFAHYGLPRSSESQELTRQFALEGARRLDSQNEESYSCKPRDIAQLSWSLGTLLQDDYRVGTDTARYFQAISNHWLGKETEENDEWQQQQQRLPIEWSNIDIIQMAVAMAHGRIDNTRLLRAIYEVAVERLEGRYARHYSSSMGQQQTTEFREWEVIMLLWASAKLYLTKEQGQVFEDFLTLATKWLHSRSSKANKLSDIGLDQQEQANLAWSLTVLDFMHNTEAQSLVSRIFQETPQLCLQENCIQLEHANQLWQTLYMLEYDCPDVAAKAPRWFRVLLKEKWTEEKAREKQSSYGHQEISRALKGMGVTHYNEHHEDIDVAIIMRNDAKWSHQTVSGEEEDTRRKIAMEFDGPNHFTRPEINRYNGEQVRPLRALGHSVLKYRLLKKQGWFVVRVPFYEFDKIPAWSSMERQRYLQRLLKTHPDISFSDVDVSEYKPLGPNRKSRYD